MEFFTQPWAWYISGPLIAIIMFLMFYLGKSLSISSSLENICSVAGVGKFVDYFKFDWRQNNWNFAFVLGLIFGGFLASQYLMPETTIELNSKTIEDLKKLGFKDIGKTYLPQEIFSIKSIFSIKGFLILLIGGLLVGFGARYAGGCTSGHAIVGLSMLQLPSLISVIGFFIGGLIMTWFILPLILK